MDFGLVVPTYGPWADPAWVREAIQQAEDLGYTTAWFGDHIVIPSYAARLSDPFWLEPISCALVGAGATKRIRMGVDVLVLPYRHPVWLSQMVASGDHLTGGRLTLGIGVGYIKGEFAAVSAPPYQARGAVTDEYLAALRVLWEAEGPVEFDGAWVQFADVYAEPKPLQRPFPLWIGGNIRTARRRAALLGNGWHPLFPTPEAYRTGREEILRTRAEHGLSGSFTFSYSCPLMRVVLGKEDRPDLLGYGEVGDIPAEYGYAPARPRAAGGRPLLVGDPDEVAADIDLLAQAGVEHLALRFSAGDLDLAAFLAQAERFVARVKPALAG
jgi:probable F420-dependent oxidoreductase